MAGKEKGVKVEGELLEGENQDVGHLGGVLHLAQSLERIWRSVLVGLLAGSQAALGVFEGGDMCPHPPSSIEKMPGSVMGNIRWMCGDCGKEFDEHPYRE